MGVHPPPSLFKRSFIDLPLVYNSVSQPGAIWSSAGSQYSKGATGEKPKDLGVQLVG